MCLHLLLNLNCIQKSKTCQGSLWKENMSRKLSSKESGNEFIDRHPCRKPYSFLVDQSEERKFGTLCRRGKGSDHSQSWKCDSWTDPEVRTAALPTCLLCLSSGLHCIKCNFWSRVGNYSPMETESQKIRLSKAMGIFAFSESSAALIIQHLVRNYNLININHINEYLHLSPAILPRYSPQ